MVTSTREFASLDSSRVNTPETLENWPFTLAIIMCFTLNSTIVWTGSMFQTVVEICGSAVVLLVMVVILSVIQIFLPTSLFLV